MPRSVQGVTVHTHFLQERVRSLGVPQERILRIPSGVDQDRFQHVSSDAVSRWQKRLHLQDRYVVVYVGTMALVSHPVDLLLEAFAVLCSRIDHVTLLLVGGGPDLETLRDHTAKLGIADRCRFTGRVDADDIPALLSLADISVDPVHDDETARARWPVKIMENLAMHVPTVTGDVGDRHEILGEGIAGLLVHPGDAQALADGMERVLIDRPLHDRLVNGCRTQAEQYALSDIVPRLLQFYEKLG